MLRARVTTRRGRTRSSVRTLLYALVCACGAPPPGTPEPDPAASPEAPATAPAPPPPVPAPPAADPADVAPPYLVCAADDECGLAVLGCGITAARRDVPNPYSPSARWCGPSRPRMEEFVAVCSSGRCTAVRRGAEP